MYRSIKLPIEKVRIELIDGQFFELSVGQLVGAQIEVEQPDPVDTPWGRIYPNEKFHINLHFVGEKAMQGWNFVEEKPAEIAPPTLPE